MTVPPSFPAARPAGASFHSPLPEAQGVDMSPAAVTARLREACAMRRMAPRAVTIRLRQASMLREACLRLRGTRFADQVKPNQPIQHESARQEDQTGK